jgi:hypothetical protein
MNLMNPHFIGIPAGELLLYCARPDLFLLVWKFGLPQLIPPQHHVQHPFHGAQQFLVRRGSASFEVGNNCGGRVALGGKVFLCHGGALVVLGLGACFGDCLAHERANRLGLDNVIGAVDLGETLALGG